MAWLGALPILPHVGFVNVRQDETYYFVQYQIKIAILD
jgi:hypothetical protein